MYCIFTLKGNCKLMMIACFMVELEITTLCSVGANTMVFQCCQIYLDFCLCIVSFIDGASLFEGKCLVPVKDELGLSTDRQNPPRFNEGPDKSCKA